jgi:hypothetical protein
VYIACKYQKIETRGEVVNVIMDNVEQLLDKSNYMGKKCTVHPITGHEGPEGE